MNYVFLPKATIILPLLENFISGQEIIITVIFFLEGFTFGFHYFSYPTKKDIE